MKNNSALIFGLRPIKEAIDSGKQLDKLFIQKNIEQSTFNELKGLAKENKIPYSIVPLQKLNSLTKKNHQGVVAFISPITYANLDFLLPSIFEKGKTPLLLILDNVSDVRNFGAIARTAECSGVDAIIIPTRGAAQINEDAVKTSAGALFKIPVCRVSFLLTTVNILKKSGFSIVSCSEKADKDIYSANLQLPTAVILGSEESGVSEELLEVSDSIIKIPMKGEIKSLNVSVACGIILFEARRQQINS